MLFDMQSLFSDRQSLAGAAGTTISTNVIDRGEVLSPQHANAPYKADLGKGTRVPLRVQITTAVAGGTSVQLQVQVSTDEAFTAPIVVAQTAAIPVASLVAGYVFPIDHIPLKTNERFVRLAYVRVGIQSAGNVTAGITLGRDQQWGS